MRWQDKLTPEERRHLRHGGRMLTLTEFKKDRVWQRRKAAEWRRIHPTCAKNAEPCPHCVRIAHKLGLE
jgi:hypothetical protein